MTISILIAVIFGNIYISVNCFPYSSAIQLSPQWENLQRVSIQSKRDNLENHRVVADNFQRLPISTVVSLPLVAESGNTITTTTTQKPKVDNDTRVKNSTGKISSYVKVKKYSVTASKRQGNGDESGVTEKTPEITSVSPIESSFGGLTGLQGLPALSVVQAIKLLIAIFPFVIPLVFVPLLLFTIGMFMIPMVRVNHYVGAENDDLGNLFGFQGRAINTAGKYGKLLQEELGRISDNFMMHEQCVEKICCRVGSKVLPSGQVGNQKHFSVHYLEMFLKDYGRENTLTGRIARSVTEKDCSSYRCDISSFLSHYLHK